MVSTHESSRADVTSSVVRRSSRKSKHESEKKEHDVIRDVTPSRATSRQQSPSPESHTQEETERDESPVRDSMEQIEPEYATVDQLQEAENDATIQVTYYILSRKRPVQNLARIYTRF